MEVNIKNNLSCDELLVLREKRKEKGKKT